LTGTSRFPRHRAGALPTGAPEWYTVCLLGTATPGLIADMIFLRSSAFIWALLAVPVVLLYLRRIPLGRQATATGFLWGQVFRDQQPAMARLKRRRLVSLSVQLGIVAMLVAAMAEPLLHRPRRIVLVVDNSSSGASLDETKQAAADLAADLGRHDEMAILTAGGAPHVRCGFRSRPDELAEAVAGLPESSEPPQIEEAVNLGRQILIGSDHGQVVVLSGGHLTAFSPQGPTLWICLAAAVLLAVAIEWCLFQRRWTC